MAIRRLFSVLAATVSVVTAVLAIRGGMAIGAAASSGQGLSDYFQRRPGTNVAAAGTDLSDYVLRHSASAIPVDTAASDWVTRHAASLCYQRHPALVGQALEKATHSPALRQQ
jgi:hypothetical protein